RCHPRPRETVCRHVHVVRQARPRAFPQCQRQRSSKSFQPQPENRGYVMASFLFQISTRLSQRNSNATAERVKQVTRSKSNLTVAWALGCRHHISIHHYSDFAAEQVKQDCHALLI